MSFTGETMSLLDIAQKNGRTYKRVSSIHGGEYHGVCPACGGNDRFHVWPEQGDHGTFWCRGCDLGGDAIEYLMKIEGLTFPAACKEVGKELAEMEEYQAPRFVRPAAADSFAPREIAAPSDPWVEHAEKFVEWSHQQLLTLGEGEGSPLAYLAGRGITRATAIKHRYGWNSGEKGKDLYKAREAWGLETILNADKKKKLWLPIGLVIPFYINDVLRRVRIRIPDERRTPQFSLSYYLVPGSSMDTYIINPSARAFVVTEAELDAGLVDQFAGDLTGCMAMGNSTAKPTSEAFALLTNCLHISNALDYDARTSDEGKYENPGGVGWLWWKKHFAQAERWPVPVGKDPGDAFKAGIDLREWVKAGLPPVLTMSAAPLAPVKPAIPVPVQDNSGAGVSAATSECEQAAVCQPTPAAPQKYSLTFDDGLVAYITNDDQEYRRLQKEGHPVMNSHELSLISESGATPDQALFMLKTKQIFGSRITGVRPGTTAADGDRPQYRGKYYPAK